MKQISKPLVESIFWFKYIYVFTFIYIYIYIWGIIMVYMGVSGRQLWVEEMASDKQKNDIS